MNLAFIKTRSTIGIRAQSVSVEVHLSPGLPAFTIVGLPQAAVKESKDRVRSAIINSQFEFPCRKITINLSPADLPKTGCGFDLPIAIGILAASAQIPLIKLESHEFIGELALCGNLRGVNAIIPVIMAARNDKKRLIIANSNAEEASITDYKNVFTATNLREVCSYLCDQTLLATLPEYSKEKYKENNLDWSDVKGQHHAKQALIIAAAGGHSILLSGPPGSGKNHVSQAI